MKSEALKEWNEVHIDHDCPIFTLVKGKRSIDKLTYDTFTPIKDACFLAPMTLWFRNG